MNDKANWIFRDIKQIDSDLELLKSNPEEYLQELESRKFKLETDLHNENNKVAGMMNRMLEMIELYPNLMRTFKRLVDAAIKDSEDRGSGS